MAPQLHPYADPGFMAQQLAGQGAVVPKGMGGNAMAYQAPKGARTGGGVVAPKPVAVAVKPVAAARPAAVASRTPPGGRPLKPGESPWNWSGDTPAATPAAPAAPTTWTNEGAVPDYLNRAVERYEGRFDTSNTARAIDRSNAGIADSAALLAKDAKANMGSRGVLGTGAGDAYLQRNVFQPAQRMAAKAATDLSLAEQDRLDRLAVGGTGVLALPSQVALANQRLNLDQMTAMNQDQRARESMDMQRENDEMAKWRALIDLEQSNPFAAPQSTGYKQTGVFGRR